MEMAMGMAATRTTGSFGTNARRRTPNAPSRPAPTSIRVRPTRSESLPAGMTVTATVGTMTMTTRRRAISVFPGATIFSMYRKPYADMADMPATMTVRTTRKKAYPRRDCSTVTGAVPDRSGSTRTTEMGGGVSSRPARRGRRLVKVQETVRMTTAETTARDAQSHCGLVAES